jgi:nonsense-mediated mRNA decay protein 3
MKSNVFNYKYTYLVEIAPVCKDDIIIFDRATSKALGGIGPVMLCHKLSSTIHLIDPLTLLTYEFDENVYWKYCFKSYVDRTCLVEFIV